MHKLKSKLFQLFMVPAGCMFIFGTCDHTNLTGTIHADKEVIYPGDSVKLKLEVPPELQEIHGIMWAIRPATDSAIISYDHLGHEFLEPSEEGLTPTNHADRKAVFLAEQPGEYHVFVSGFYKQTNPQPITDTILKVKPEKIIE